MRLIHSFYAILFTVLCLTVNAQVTPIAIDNTPANDCAGNDCWDFFNWTPVQDSGGNPIGGDGIAEDAGCGTTIGAAVEYTGPDYTPDFTGTLVGANTTDGVTQDVWTFSFDEALTNPIFDVNSLENDTEMCFTDCLGNPLTITILGTSLDPGPSGAHCVTSGTNFIQITGTYDCIMVTGTIPDNDPYTLGVATCLSENPPPPVPPCTTCPAGTDYELISLDETGTDPTTGLPTGIIEINNVCIGSFEFLFSDLDVNEDANGTQFGGWDTDGGTMLLELEFCDPLIVQQLDIRNLEVESEVSVGTTIAGSGASAVLGGQTLTVCSDPSGRMGVDTNPDNGEMNFVKTDGPGCGANPNGSYTFGTNPVTTLYFKYHNPPGGCTGDYVGFRIGTCYTPPPMVAPVCPVEIVQVTCDMADVIANGPNNSNTDEYAVDGNGNYFNFSSCSAALENAVIDNDLLQTVDIGCAELVQTTEECLIESCIIIPPCATCPVGSEFKFINLANGSDTDGDGYDEGQIFLDGVCIGEFDVLFSDLDVSEDVSGTQFGGWDNDGGVYALQLDFCDPLLVEELYIRNLEVESQVSIGTTISGTPGPGAPATLGGLDLTFCDGSLRMLPEDPPVNMVITDGPGCGANPNAVYTIGGTPVTTLYFQYHNPPGGCTGDYVGFKVGTCYTPPPMEIPVCPVEIVTITCDMDDVIANGPNASNTDEYAVDGNGNYFDYQSCGAAALQDAVANETPLQTIDIGCSEMVATEEECNYDFCTIAPTCAATMCPQANTFDYISLDETGTSGGGFPIGTIRLDNVKIGTYEFLFSDLDVSEDGNGTTFGGWDNDGGTMLLQMDFCDPLTIQELDVRNLEVESEVSIGTTIVGAGASAILGGQTLTVCDDPSGRMGVGPAPNEVITDGPGCGANPNATYTVGTNPVTTLYFKYHNPPGGCRGDYVGFRIGVCNDTLPTAIPTCPLTLFEIDECPNDPTNTTFQRVQDDNGNWFDFSGTCPTAIPTTSVQTVKISACATTTLVDMCPGCCELVVDCSNVVDSNLACLADLPPTDVSLVIVLDSCDVVTRSVSTVIPPNTGCPNDTLFITRTYTVDDGVNPPEECMQTFTVISTMDPTFTSFPSDTTVECGAATDPAATGMATGAGECDPADPQATVSSTDAITAGACPQEMTIVRTWTVTDRCGRMVSMDQTIMVVDTVAPTMVCQNITIELDENGMATADPNAVDNGSSDNCGGPVALSLSMDMFTCDNTGPNDVWLIGEDECGNVDSCMAVITVEDNIDPTITCPADIEMPNDFGVCGAIVEYDVVADDNCGFDVMQTEGIPSGGFFPVGETTNCFTVTDDSGATAECCFTVTINDEEGPMIECPDDMTIQLESGECEEVLYYDIPFMDNCGTIDAEMSQAVNEALVSTALDCANNTSNHLRYFTNTLPVPVEITQVNFGIFNSGVSETVTVNIYAIMPGAPFIYANMILVGTTDHAVPAGMNQVILTAMVEATIPVGMDYVLELRANNTTNFVIGYNTAGETGSTFISGNPPVPCVSLEPVDIDLLGFGAFAVVLYSNAEGGPFIEQTGGLPSGSYFPIGTTTNTFKATDIYGNMTICEFDVEVLEFTDGVTGTLACNNDVNISLDENCEVNLNADMILEGNVYGCFDDYIIEISGVTGTIITEPGMYTVTITDPDSGNSCWGTINVEGKAVPIIDCAEALCPISMLQGEWTAEDNTFSPGAAWAFDGFPPNNDILYDVIQFAVEVPGIYTFTMTPSPDFDGIAGIYADSFDPDMPALNLIGGDDDIPGVFESEPDFMIFLDAGTYFLVSSTWGAGQMGIYTWSFSGPGDLLSNCEVKCYELDALLSGELEIPSPQVTSCVPFTLSYSDSVDNSDCGVTIVTRTYVAESANGGSSCEVTFEIDPLSVALDVDLPIQLVELTCNDGTDPDEIVAIFDDPLTTDDPNTAIVENNEGYVYAYPTYEVNGHPQKIDNNACNVFATYTDQDIEACNEGCNGNRKVLRTWSILDWCTQEITTYMQTIKAVDTEAPSLFTQDITLSTDPWGCSVNFDVPLPWELHDNCDSNPKYIVTGPAGVLITGSMETGFTAIGTPKGVNTFYYVAFDCCENEQSYPFTVTVVDATPPVVAVTQNIVISLTSGGSSSGDGLAKLYAQSVDNGSYDGCTDIKLEVRREADICDIRGNTTYNDDGHPQDGSPNPNSPGYDPDGGAYVKFCCDDISNATVDVNGDGELDAGYVKVWLRVWDDGDMDGIFGTDGDNYNESWAFVKVEDKLAPTIQCPPDVTLTCDMDYTDLNMTGSATANGSCGNADVEYNDIIINLTACNEGFIRRRWNIVGRSDLFCDQTITMERPDAPVNVSFSQVQDFTAANCPDMISLGEPTWLGGPCDVIGYTMDTDTFKFEDGACYKIVNYWTVINWCEYDPNNPFWNGEGIWTHTQVIKVTDETKPVIDDCEDKMFAINDHSDSDNDGEVCEAKIILTNIATDPGSDNCPTGWLKWQVFIDLWGDGTDDLEFSSFLPPFDNLFNDTNGNGIPDKYVSPTSSGSEISIPLPDIAGSMSNHKVRWKVTDGCNNTTTCNYDFMVVDKKAPTPYCVSLSSVVMEADELNEPFLELWAIDFNIGSFDNCTPEENLRFTFTDVAPEDDPLYDPTQRSSSRIFDCDDVANSPVDLQMYVWDEKGNRDFCIVTLTFHDNASCDFIGGNKSIAGNIATEKGNVMVDVATTLHANLLEYPRTQMTNENGEYAFMNNPLGISYEISASKDIDYLNGVSTLDLVKIQRHILGLESLDSPYKLVAADINADNNIKASDLTQLRKLILGVITDLPTNESWRFVDAYQELDMDSPLADFEFTAVVSNLQTAMMNNDLIAVKIGDVTNNASSNLVSDIIENRSSKTLTFAIDEQEVIEGEIVEIAFTSEDFTDVFGYQFTIELNGLEFKDVQGGAIDMLIGNVGVLSKDIVTMSYNYSTAVTASKEEAIFSITVEATRNGKLTEMISITSKVTPSEAYIGQSLEVIGVELSTRDLDGEMAATELYQNEPNPFKGLTTIGFNLADAGSATLTVFDVTGKMIVNRYIDGVKGYNAVNLTANQLGASGVLYYKLECGDFTATKKMIIIE